MAIFDRPPTDWLDLQRLTAQLFEEMGCQVEIGKVVELARGQKEIDVWISDRDATPPSVYLTECKFWGRRVEQEVVHSFRTVVSDYGAHRGFIVSKVGFQSGAREAAQHTNIDLLTFDELQEFFEVRWRESMLRNPQRGPEGLGEASTSQRAVNNDVKNLSSDELRRLYAPVGIRVVDTPAINLHVQERLFDYGPLGPHQLPNKFRQLDLADLNPNFFEDASKIMRAVAALPPPTRRVYGHALAYSHAAANDLDVYCIPFELSQQLRVTEAQLEPHFQILATHDLLWLPEYKDDWRIPPSSGWRAHFRHFDKEDNGIYFLWMLRKRFDASRETIIEIFEKPNNHLLDDLL